MGGVGDTHGSFTGQLIYTDILHACLLFECPRPPKKKTTIVKWKIVWRSLNIYGFSFMLRSLEYMVTNVFDYVCGAVQRIADPMKVI